MIINNIYLKRFIEVVEERKDKIWSIESLLQRINFLIPSNIELDKQGLITLMSNQREFKVFRSFIQVDGKRKGYYIFRKCLPK